MKKCPDCAVKPGEQHQPGCDVERCSVCKGQKFSCECEQHDPEQTKWDGEWPGTKECQQHGWYAIMTPEGWRPCPAGTPECMEDMNRLAYFHEYGKDELYASKK